jgi:predicted DNA-binding transcriptional regulator AlpA
VSGRHHLYRAYGDDGELLYVGISLYAFERLCQHRRGSAWFDEVETIRIARYATQREAELAEREAIRTERPRYNIAYRSRPAPRSEKRPPPRLLSLGDVIAEREAAGGEVEFVPRTRFRRMLGIGREQFEAVQREPGFPEEVRLSPGKASHFRRSEIESWLQENARCRGEGLPPDI